MITLRTDCLIFKLAGGESMPLSPEMLVGELPADKGGQHDPEVLHHAAGAVFHYFKHDLGLEAITMGEFAEAFEKVLHGFESAAGRPREIDGIWVADLRTMARESGQVSELSFFPVLRGELKRRLEQTPGMLRFIGVRTCVKELTGARRWTTRCQLLRDRIVEFIRECAQVDSPGKNCEIIVR